MNKIKFLLPASILAVALIIMISPVISAQSQRRPFVPRPLTNATEAELRQVALDYTYSTFKVDGTPTIQLSMPKVTKDQLPLLGLNRVDFVGQEPPLALVALHGTFDISSLPGMQNAGSNYHYLVYVFDLKAGIPTHISFSRDGSKFKKLLNDPSLPEPPMPPSVNPNNLVPAPEVAPTAAKLPYGSIAPAVATENPVSPEIP